MTHRRHDDPPGSAREMRNLQLFESCATAQRAGRAGIGIVENENSAVVLAFLRSATFTAELPREASSRRGQEHAGVSHRLHLDPS